MPNDPLDEVLGLKQRATALRNRGAYDAALRVLDQAIALLLELATKPRPNTERVHIAAELADAWGMKGGVHRRCGDPAAAMTDYKKGFLAEPPESLSTYNLGNVILLSIQMDPKRIDDGSLESDIRMLIGRVETNLRGERSDEWWLWADLMQFRLLSGDLEGARVALRRGRVTGPNVADFQRPFDVLSQVADGVAAARPEQAERLRRFIAQAPTLD